MIDSNKNTQVEVNISSGFNRDSFFFVQIVELNMKTSSLSHCSIRSSLESHDQVELEAAIFATDRLCAQSR